MSNIKKNILYQVAYRVLTVITPLITSPIISRALGAEGLGVYSATQAYANYFVLFAMLGVEYYGQRTIAAAKSIERKQTVFWEIFTVHAIASCISLGAYFGSAFLFGRERLPIMLVQGLWVVSCLLDINWFFFGMENFKITVTRNLIVRIVTVLSIVVFIREPEDLVLYAFIMAGGTAVSQLLLWSALRKFIHFERVSFSGIKTHISPIVHLFIPMLALSLYHYMDKTMLDVLSNEAEVGFYYSADKIIYIPLGVITAVSTVMLPRISNVLTNDSINKTEFLLNKSSEVNISLACAIGFGIGAISKEFAPFFFGVGYEPVGILIKVFVPVLIIKTLSDVVRAQYLIPAKKDRQYTTAVSFGAITNIICNAILIPLFGALGAVLGTLVAESVVLFVAMFACRKEINFLKIFTKHWCYLVFGMAMYVLVRLVSCAGVSLPVFIRLIVMTCVGAAVYMIMCSCYWIKCEKSTFNPYVSSIICKVRRSQK